MQEMNRIDNLPNEIFLKVINSGNHWNLINSSSVSKSWHVKLKPSFSLMKEVYESLIDQTAEVIIEKSKKSILTAQVVMMASGLLKKLTLDQVVAIACSSYKHAEILFKSKFFHDQPEPKPVKTIRSSENIDPMLEILEQLETIQGLFDLSDDIFDHFFPLFNDYDDDFAEYCNKLNRPGLLEEELALSGTPSPKTLCRKYIARAIAEMNVSGLQLVASEAKFVLNKERLIKLAKISPEYTWAILDEKVSTGKIDTKIMQKISSMSLEHQKIISKYAITLLCLLPLKMARHDPQNTKKLAQIIIKNFFYSSRNPFLAELQKNQPEKARRILESNKLFRPEKLSSIILISIIAISPEAAKGVLSTKGVRKYIDVNILKNIASKDPSYDNLVTQFLSSNRNTHPAGEATGLVKK